MYPFIHYPMCSIKIPCNLLNFPLLRTKYNKQRPIFLRVYPVLISLWNYTTPLESRYIDKKTNGRARGCKRVREMQMRYILILHAFDYNEQRAGFLLFVIQFLLCAFLRFLSFQYLSNYSGQRYVRIMCMCFFRFIFF